MPLAKKPGRSMSKRPSGEWLDWCQTKERIGQQLRVYYRACTTEELTPRMLELVKKLDETRELTAKQVQVIRDIES
jgi:hypothetical protein